MADSKQIADKAFRLAMFEAVQALAEEYALTLDNDEKIWGGGIGTERAFFHLKMVPFLNWADERLKRG